MSKVFIGYRRDDARGSAGRIYDRLADQYGAKRVFRDVDAIGSGENFVEAVEEALTASAVKLVVIGPDWLTIADREGRRRLDDPADHVRVEIELALDRDDLRVIPVLVSGAVMPRPDDLPEPLRPLALLNALDVRETRFDDDVDHLIERIGLRPRPLAWVRTHRPQALAGAAAVAAAGGLAAFQLLGGSGLAPLTGEFNVAVAEFTATGDEEGASPEALSAVAYAAVSERLAGFVEAGEFNEPPGMAGPDDIGTLAGETDEEGAAAARELAGEIQADVVLFGNLHKAGGSSRFTSSFYLSDRSLDDAEELAGLYPLTDVVVPSTSQGTVNDAVLPDLEAQAEALASLMVALRRYAVNDYEAAETHLLAAEAGWRAGDAGGKEVVLHLLGNVAGQLGRLADAAAYYDRALALDPAYARARFGRAQVLFQQSQGAAACFPSGSPDVAGLETALAEFTAVQELEAPPLSFLPERSLLEMGRVGLCLHLAGEDRMAAARADLEAVVAADDGSDPRLRDLAVEALQNLGLAHVVEDEYQAALAEYDTALDLLAGLAGEDARRAELHQARGDVYCFLDDPAAAQAAYERADELAGQPVPRVDC